MFANQLLDEMILQVAPNLTSASLRTWPRSLVFGGGDERNVSSVCKNKLYPFWSGNYDVVKRL